MTHNTELTNQKYGLHRLVFIPNRFDTCDLSEAIEAIGETVHAELIEKAEKLNWSEKRLELEIRCTADEAAANSEPE